MNEFKEFLEKLNKYEPNSGTLEIRTILNELVDIEPTKTLYRGNEWLFFTKNNITLKYNPRTDEIEIVEKNNIDDSTEEIVRTNYSVDFLDYIRIKSKRIVNVYTKRNESYYLLIEANLMIEEYTKAGFQKRKQYCFEYNSKLIAISEEYRNMYQIIVPSKDYQVGNDGVLENNGIEIQKEFCHYFLNGDNWNMNASKDEKISLIACYSTDPSYYGNPIFFPAFFDENKNIIINPFIEDSLLQFYSEEYNRYNGFDDDDVSFENHSIEDAKKYIENRHYYRDYLLTLEGKTHLTKTLQNFNKY